MEEARISIFRSRDAAGNIDDVIAEASSGSDGFFQIPLEVPLDAAISVTKSGYCELEDYLFLDGAGTPRRDYVLQRAVARVHGKVATSAGEPISGAMVFVSFPRIFKPGQDKAGLAARLAFTDSNGEFSIGMLPSATVNMAASGKGYLTSEPKTVTLEPGAGAPVRFVLREAEVVSLHIRDPNGSPITSAYAELPEGLASADRDATVAVPIPKTAKSLEVTIRADGYLSRIVEIGMERPPGEVVLFPGAVIGGQVIGEQSGLPGATVAVFSSDSGRERWEKTVSTDGSGRFSVQISAAKASRIAVSHPGHVSTVITVADESSPRDFTIELKPSEAGIFGRVLDDRGTPVKEFVVYLEEVSEGKSGFRAVRAFFDPDGVFSLTDLPAGVFNLRVVDQVNGRSIVVENLRLRRGLACGDLQIQLTERDSG